MWETVDLRELRVFLALADELHFGRTAERLHLTPSRVSQSLRSLEAKLGGQLVYRTSRRVELTPLGVRFQQEAGPAYAQLTAVLQRTYAANRTLAGTVHLGLLTGPAAGPHLGAIIDVFVGEHPECDVVVEQVAWGEDPFAQLRRGEIDVMASWLPLAQPDLVVGPTLSDEPRVLAVAHDHALADREEVSIEDLADYRVARFVDLPDELHDAWIPTRTPSGRAIPSVRVNPPDRDMVGFARRVSRGEIVHPTALSIASYLGDLDLRFVPISDMPPLRSALVWRRTRIDARLREFVRVAERVLREASADVSVGRSAD